MSFRSVTIPVTLARPIDGMILGSRMAVADILREHAREAVARATEAGVDGVTSGQRMVMDFVAAARASRLLRVFPGPVARWCFQTEQHAVQLESASYPAAPKMTIGLYGPTSLSLMPAGVVLVRAGGINATGTIAADAETPIVPHEIREVRLTKSPDLDGRPTYQCTVIMSSDTGQREFNEDPVEPQPVLEPEDQ